MAAYAVINRIESVDLEVGTNKIILTLLGSAFNTVSDSRYDNVMFEVKASFEGSDWRIKAKEAVKAKCMADFGETIEWLLLPDLTKI